MSIIQGTSKAAGGGYEIENSVRLDGTGDMSRTVSSDGNLRTWTFSFWLKRSTFGTNGGLGFNVGGTYVNGDNRSIFRFHSTLSGGDDDWYWAERSGAAWREDQATSSMHRDPAAWAHYMCVWDTDGGTTPRARRYINGVLVSDLKSGGTVAAANVDSGTNKAGTFQLFDQAGFPGREFEGYCAEMHFVDGTALAPTDFGEFNDDGVWIPIKTSGITYGSNGFYLDFADSSDLGKDVSGNSNDFTSSGLATTDQMSDTPTDNHCTFNPLWIDTYTLSDGNLVTSTGADASALGTMAVDATDSDGWYWEMKVTTAATYPGVGIILASQTSLVANTALSNTNTNRYYYQGWDGQFNNQNSATAYGSTWSGTANKVIGVYLKGGALWFSIDGVVQNSGDPSTASTGAAITGLTGDFYPVVLYAAGSGTQAAWTAQFAEADWGTTPPAGYKAVNTANLATPSITDGSAHFQPTLYTGTGSSQAVSQAGNSTFQPDWVWIKGRSGATEHVLTDAVRGVTKELSSNDTGAEETVAQGLTAFDSAGFTVGTDGSYNTSSATYVGWQWKANGSGSSNTDGDITSTVSTNTTSGFSIVKYAGSLSTTGSATVGHGLGIAPSVVISKSLDSTAGDSGAWAVQHTSLAASNILRLNTTAATSDKSANGTLSSPTSTVFYTNYTEGLNVTGNDYIAYCFAEVPGYSSFGSYTGNGSTDGPFVYTGFKPALVLLKRTNTTQEWQLYDNQRDPYNVANHKLEPNSSNTESILTTDNNLDFLSNGFKLRKGNGGMNASGSTYIYMAFAEHPFGGVGVAPATAR